MTDGASAWEDAALCAALLAVEPGLGGACLRARTGPAQAAWIGLYGKLDPGRKLVRVPPGIADERLFGGLDLAATLAAGRPVHDAGLLAGSVDRALILPMAERATAGLASRLGGALDRGSGFTLIALDEGAGGDERAAETLTDRLAFQPRLELVMMADLTEGPDAEAVAGARARLGSVRTPEGLIESLVGAAASLGITSLRAPLLALLAARAAAALAGAPEVDKDAAIIAARLVLGPRARTVPAPAEEDEDETPPPEPPQEDASETPPDVSEAEEKDRDLQIPEELLLDAARANIPPDVIAQLLGEGAFRGPAAKQRGAGADQKSKARGRPAGSTRGHPRDGSRLDLIETLRAAAPWQPLRRMHSGDAGRILVRADDFRVKRSKVQTEKVVIFAVDASGSTALARLAESKGAVELMLGQAYVARQQVALIAFRGVTAEMLLPPTRSLVLTKRRLASLPGGGATPLAAGLNCALTLARLTRSRGARPFLALLTDGKANVALDGAPGRPQAEADAQRIARIFRQEGLAATVIDTGNRPTPAAKALADAMGATYLPLPRADAKVLASVMTSAVAGAA